MTKIFATKLILWQNSNKLSLNIFGDKIWWKIFTELSLNFGNKIMMKSNKKWWHNLMVKICHQI